MSEIDHQNQKEDIHAAAFRGWLDQKMTQSFFKFLNAEKSIAQESLETLYAQPMSSDKIFTMLGGLSWTISLIKKLQELSVDDLKPFIGSNL